MAIGVDTSKWKPRQVKGTPAAAFRNALGIGIISVGIVTGLLFHFSSLTTNLRKAWDVLYEDPIEEVERRMLIGSSMANKTGDQIRAMLDENQNKVTSKYFTTEPMDNSLSDFQEVKRSYSGPKTSKINSKKPRKALKRPRGQKDIRTALKPKKNDLITYTEKFDTVCKNAGIDVDTEELQLAIALSKSLQTDVKDEYDLTEISSQDRVKRIRTTLQEYGFKVPETKITINNKKRKHRKNYQLISKSDTEKEQIISDKYSQVLFANVEELNKLNDLSVSDTPLFYKATNISYKYIKDNDVFYCVELVERSTSDGCLLRDWAEIPGRPASPKALKGIEMNFSEIECSQEELDIVLSGPFIKAKKILRLKQIEKQNLQESRKHDNSNEFKELHINKDLPNITIEVDKEIRVDNNVNHEAIYRSCSPDMFEDEDSVIEVIATNNTIQEANNGTMDLTECVNRMPLKNNTLVSKNNLCLSQKCNKDMTRKKSDDFMEITDCVASISRPIMNVDITQVETKENVVAGDKTTLDLTQSSDSGDDLPEVFIGNKNTLDDTVPLNFSDYEGILNKVVKPSPIHNSEVYDLTQEHTLETIEGNEISCNNKDVEILRSNKSYIDKANKMDLKTIQTSDSSYKTDIQENIEINDDDLCDNQRHSEIYSPSKKQISDNSIKDLSIELCMNKDLAEDNIDLTQTSNASAETVIIDQQNTNSNNNHHIITENSNLDLHSSSPDRNIAHKEIDDNEGTDIELNKDLREDNIDLTQSSNSSITNTNNENKNESNLEHMLGNSDDSDKTVILPLNDNYGIIDIQYENLGKIDDISIDYDDVYYRNDVSENYMGKSNTLNKSQGKNKSDNSHSSQKTVLLEENGRKCDDTIDLSLEDYEKIPNPCYELGRKNNISIDYDEVSIIDVDKNYGSGNNTGTSTSKRNKKGNTSKETEIIDAEYYSNSKRGNFDLGGISVLAGLSNGSLRKSDVPDIDNNELPMVDVKHREEYRTPDKRGTNLKRKDVTPEDEYIIKFDNVSPMPNYEAMTTPERNVELDKYGLKPFKRKRAIQLLTHIYNQTHPIIESLDDIPSPSKRFKGDQPSPRFCRELLLSPKKALEILEAQDLFEVTNETPDLKEVECPDEDWVFQKREKSKLHSCRVPLHIAFHNFVSCRRRLREAILRYEPVDIDVIHKQLVEYGHRYDPKELLKFLDKKCITIKTGDSTKNNRY